MLFNNSQEDGTHDDEQNFETYHTAEFPDDQPLDQSLAQLSMNESGILSKG